jgi:hypothetical protein
MLVYVCIVIEKIAYKVEFVEKKIGGGAIKLEHRDIEREIW